MKVKKRKGEIGLLVVGIHFRGREIAFLAATLSPLASLAAALGPLANLTQTNVTSLSLSIQMLTSGSREREKERERERERANQYFFL